MEQTLSRFIDKTGCDPAFARDLLEGKKWDFDEALKAFEEFSLGSNGTIPKQKKKTVRPQRGISVVNSDIVIKARTKVQEKESPGTDSQYESFEEMARFTFVLPDLSSYPRDFADFLREDLIETSALVTLEQSGHLNWWSDIGVCQRLVPLATVGDGNCLLHAASLGMWGFHDRLLTLRKALFRTLISDLASAAIKRRWRFQQYQKNLEAGGLVYSEEEWEKEWKEVLRLASTNRRKLCSYDPPKVNENKSLPSIDEGGEKPSLLDNQDNLKEETKKGSPESTSQSVSGDKENSLVKSSVDKDIENGSEVKKEKPDSPDDSETESEGAFESLEEIHVFVLAHVLRRPIIIIADKYLRDFSGDLIAPIPFGGIFLPLECPPKTCLKTPLILAFESAHFSAVVATESNEKQGGLVNAIPVVNHDYELLPLQFSLDTGENFDWEMLDKETELPAKLLLSEEHKLQMLGKYLDLVQIKIPCAGKSSQRVGKTEVQQNQKQPQTNVKQKEVAKDGEKGLNSWLNSQLLKVGNLAGKLKGSLDSSTLCAAKLKTNEKPEYYDEMIQNYIESARKRFEERKDSQVDKRSEGSSNQLSQPCITQGCQMYGRVDTNYLCSGCYRTQKSASEAGIYKKPSGTTHENIVEAKPTFKSYLPSSYLPYANYPICCNTGTTTTGSTPSLKSTSTALLPSYEEVCQDNIKRGSNKCLREGCTYYGSPERNGYCSTCFKNKNKSL